MSNNAVNPHSFQGKVARANPNLICTAKADAVRVITVKDLLQTKLRIPIFQRRYCWAREQWRTLLGDVSKVAKGLKSTHALGRITCAVKPDSPYEGLVIDGQQRHTTCVLLLASLRDVMLQRNPSESIIADINRLLFPDHAALASWTSSKLAASLETKKTILVDEGEELSFAAVVPTYCDRASFYVATLPPDLAPAGISCSQSNPSTRCSSGNSSMHEVHGGSAKSLQQSVAWRRPAEAKAYFLQELQSRNDEELRALATAMLGGLQWLYFPITISSNSNSTDGTDDLAIIFERLAQRDATCCRPHRRSEYADMGAADFVRNLVLGSFSDEATSISVYKRLWLPLEQAAALAADAASPSAIKSNGVRKDGGVAVVLEDFLEAFLAEQALPEAACTSANATSKYSAMPTYVGGQLYAQFRAWFENALNDATIAADEPTSAQAIDRTLLAAGSTSRDGSAATLRINENDAIVESHLQKLFDFAHIYFASLGGEQGSKVVRLEAQSQRPQELAQLENQQPLKPSDQPLLSRFRGIRGQNVMDPPRPKQKRASAEVPSSQKGYGDPKLTSV